MQTKAEWVTDHREVARVNFYYSENILNFIEDKYIFELSRSYFIKTLLCRTFFTVHKFNKNT